jgi:hypothetical protein
MPWEDIAVLLIRSAGAMASALAGIAALMTDGAFLKRETPLDGFWRDTPFGKYRITRWGGILLAVILIAPAVQLSGDLLKDHLKDKRDASELEKTTERIENRG